MQINPDMLKKASNRNAQPVRNSSMQFMVMIKSALQNIVLRIRHEDDEYYRKTLTDIVQKLAVVSENIKSAKAGSSMIAKADMQASQISNLSVTNLEKVSVENIDDLDISFKELSDIVKQLTELRKAVIANKPAKTPTVQAVKVVNSSLTKDLPVNELISAIKKVEQAVGSLRIEVPRMQEIKIPEMPKTISVTENKQIIRILEMVGKKLDGLPKSFPDLQMPRSISIDNFPPQKYPMPVTHISINALAGTVKSRAVTVTTALTPLPGEVLAHRRSLIIYNNSSSTVFIGGSDMLAADGLPVPANTYSPPIDAGESMIVYGRTSTGSAEVRVLEASDINVGR